MGNSPVAIRSRVLLPSRIAQGGDGGVYGTTVDQAKVSPDSKPSAKAREENTAIDSKDP